MPTAAQWIQRIKGLADEGLQESTAQVEDAKALISDAVQEAAGVGAAPDAEKVESEFAYRNVRISVAAPVPIWAGQPWLYAETTGNGPTRLVGECWGMSRLSHPAPGGTLLRTGPPAAADRVEWKHGEEGGAYYLACGLGATFREAASTASENAYCLPNLPGFSGLTVAGCIGVGGHGSGLRLGPLASMVRRIQFGHPETGQAEGGCEYARDDELFELAVCHLGRLGPVLAIDLDVVPKYDIRETRTVVEVPKTGVAAWATLLKQAIEAQAPEGVHSAEIWIAPYPDNNLYVTALGVRRRAKPKPIPETLPLTNHNPALVGLGYLASVLTNQLDQVAHKIPALLRAAVRLTAHGGAHMSGTDGLDFGSANSIPAASIELAIDLKDVERAATALHELLEQLNALAQQKPPLHLLSPIGIRFTDAAPSNSLAPQAGRKRTMHVEVPTFNHASCHAHEILEPIQRFMASKHKARPHWGQRIYLEPRELAALWREEARHAFAKLVKKHDPKRRFANPLLDEMLEV